MNHWATKYIGIPWAYGAQGPDAFDCWNFVRAVQREHFHMELPIIDYGSSWQDAAKALDSHPEKGNWLQVDSPDEGDVVMMARARIPVHIGIWIKANGTNGVLHCLQGAGVLFQTGGGLALAGWGKLEFYRRITNE